MGPLTTLRGRPFAAPRAGFTLVELMVVIVVIGIAAALIVVNVGDSGERDLTREAKRFAGALEHAQALAQWQRATLGVSAEGRGYRFWRRDANESWTALAGDDVLAPRTLPDGMAVVPQSFAGAPVAADAILPFRASGRNEPFAFALASAAGRIVVSGDPVGRVRYAVATASSGLPAAAN